jgi:hypothetical protein
VRVADRHARQRWRWGRRRWRWGRMLGAVGEWGGATTGQSLSRCPERRHLKQQMGSLQSAARCPLPRQLKQRP